MLLLALLLQAFDVLTNLVPVLLASGKATSSNALGPPLGRTPLLSAIVFSFLLSTLCLFCQREVLASLRPLFGCDVGLLKRL